MHQGTRLGKFSQFDVGSRSLEYYTKKWFSEELNKKYIGRICQKKFLPINQLLLSLLKQVPNLGLSFRVSGESIELMGKYAPELLQSFKELGGSKFSEFMAGTYYDSLVFNREFTEFAEQISLDRKMIFQTFRQKAKTFANTALVYSDAIGEFVRKLGFEAALIGSFGGGVGESSPILKSSKIKLSSEADSVATEFRFTDKTHTSLKLLLPNKDFTSFYNLPDQKYGDTALVKNLPEVTVIYIDYENFSELVTVSPVVLEKFADFVIGSHSRGVKFEKISELADQTRASKTFESSKKKSLNMNASNLKFLTKSDLQLESIEAMLEIKNLIEQTKARRKHSEYQRLLEIYRKLSGTHHLFYMSTDYWNASEFLSSFNNYESPYDAYINFMNVVSGFRYCLEKIVQS